MTAQPIYLDNAASTQPSPEVIKAFGEAMRENYGNPSSLHGKGLMAERAISRARSAVALVLGADPENVFFTSGGTEANNLAVFGACARGPKGNANRIVTTAMEHPSVLQPLKALENKGWRVSYLKADSSGAVARDVLENALDESVALISFAHVNNETGVIFPLDTVKTLRDRKCPGALLHIDCAQSFAKLFFSTGHSGADLVSVSAHKIHGPKGIGALYISKRAHITPIIYGGGQERGVRSGTENTPAAVAFGIAAKEARDAMETGAEHARALKRRLLEAIDKNDIAYTRIPDYSDGTPHTRISGDVDVDGGCSPYILSLSFPGAPAELLLNLLDREGVYVSSGAACSSRRAVKTGSHVLNAMGLKPDVVESAIRFSFSRFNTIAEMDFTAERLKNAIMRIPRRL